VVQFKSTIGGVRKGAGQRQKRAGRQLIPAAQGTLLHRQRRGKGLWQGSVNVTEGIPNEQRALQITPPFSALSQSQLG
jgi:hypothetical protein